MNEWIGLWVKGRMEKEIVRLVMQHEGKLNVSEKRIGRELRIAREGKMNCIIDLEHKSHKRTLLSCKYGPHDAGMPKLRADGISPITGCANFQSLVA